MKIKKKLLINILLLMVLIKPKLFECIDSINTIYYILRVIVAMYVFIRYITYKKYSKFTLMMILYCVVLAISTIINSGDIIRCLGSSMNTIALIMFTEILLMEDVDMMFKSYITLLDIYLIINTLFVVFTDGITIEGTKIVYFLGGDNRFIFFYLPAIYFRFCYSYYKFNKLRKSDYLVYMLCLLTLIYQWSVGAMIGLLLYIPFIIFIVNRKYLDKLFNMFTYLTIILLSNYLIVIKQIQFLFEDFIVNVLKKDPTLSARTLVWTKTLEWIKEKTILGNGYEFENVVMQKIRGANHPHNYILTLLYRGGIVYFGIFLSMIILAGIKMKKFKDNKITKIISFTIFIALIMSIADSFDFALFFVMIQLGYHIEIIVKNQEKENISEEDINIS